MSYDKSTDLKSIQADVLTIDTGENEHISGLKKLKTNEKSIVSVIDALNDQLGNAQSSAANAVANVVELENIVAELNEQLEKQRTYVPGIDAEHVFGLVYIGWVFNSDFNYEGEFVRINEHYEPVDFDPSYSIWANMKRVVTAYGEFVEIPVTWVRTEVLTDGPYAGKQCWWVSDHAEESFHVHPAFIGKDGQPHNLQIASYMTSKENDLPVSRDTSCSINKQWNELNYNVVHNMSLPNDMRPYSIYDHHLLARLMMIEFGTDNVQTQTVNNVPWDGEVEHRVNYHGIHDLFGFYEKTKINEVLIGGQPTAVYQTNSEACWLDGFTSLNGTYQVMAADGSGQMIETGVPCFEVSGYPTCFINKTLNGIDFGDIFIGQFFTDSIDRSPDSQSLAPGYAFFTTWLYGRYYGMFYLSHLHTDNGNPEDAYYINGKVGWRLARCV